MKKPVIAALFMSLFAFGLAALAIFWIYQSTAAEVEAVRREQQYIQALIDKTSLEQKQDPTDSELTIKLEKLNMERVLLPQPWALEMEMVDNGPISFLANIFKSSEARKESLRKIVLERAGKTDLSGCPKEFVRLFRIYASPTGYGSESLQNLREFAEKHGSNNDLAAPENSQTDSSR
jgi:hypothetical protein